MGKDTLEREYGVLLGVTGPILMERAFWYREMAKLLEEDGSPRAARYLRMQADRAEETVKSLAKGFENVARTK